MILNIDVDKLKHRAEELRVELKSVESILELIDKFGVQTPGSQVLPHEVPLHNGRRRGGYTQEKGLQKSALLLLYTGPASKKALGRAMKWTAVRAGQVVSGLLRRKLAFLTEHGTLQLSSEGKKQAAWFMTHPEKTIYYQSREKK